MRESGDEECVIDADYAVPAMSTSHDYWESLYRKRDAVPNSPVAVGLIEPRADVLSGTSMADFLTLMDAPVDDPRIDLDIPAKLSPSYSPVDEVQHSTNEDKHYKVSAFMCISSNFVMQNIIQLLRILQESPIENDAVKKLLVDYNIVPAENMDD